MQRFLTWIAILLAFGMVTRETGRDRSRPSAGSEGVHMLDGSGGGPPPTT